MKKQEIARIIHTYFLRLKKHFRSIEKDMTETSIKPFRIEIKKIRAFLRLLELKEKNPDDLKLPHPLKEMHKSGGKFRDLLLLQQRIKEAVKKKGDDGLRIDSLLKENRQQVKKEQKRFFSQKDFAGEEKKLKKHLPENYSTNTIKLFFHGKKENILDVITKGTFTDKELHDIRKKLKDILYILNLYRVDVKAPVGTRLWNKTELLKVKELEDDLGFINDARNALSLLTSDEIRQFKPAEKKILLYVRRDLLAEKRKLKKQVLASIKKIFPLRSSR